MWMNIERSDGDIEIDKMPVVSFVYNKNEEKFAFNPIIAELGGIRSAGTERMMCLFSINEIEEKMAFQFTEERPTRGFSLNEIRHFEKNEYTIIANTNNEIVRPRQWLKNLLIQDNPSENFIEHQFIARHDKENQWWVIDLTKKFK